MRDGGSAFPIPLSNEPGAYPTEPGMSLRAWLTGQAIAGICASPHVRDFAGIVYTSEAEFSAGIGRHAVMIADAALSALSDPPPPSEAATLSQETRNDD